MAIICVTDSQVEKKRGNIVNIMKEKYFSDKRIKI